jgi:hypothetical protein
MARTPDEVTAAVDRSTNPEVAKQKIWEASRYLVAVKIAHSQTTVTQDGYFKGHHVIPGPRCNPNLQPRLRQQDFNILENIHGITITNYETTDGATDDIGQAMYRPMDDAEANEYEQVILKDRVKNMAKDQAEAFVKKVMEFANGNNKSKGVPS